MRSTADLVKYQASAGCIVSRSPIEASTLEMVWNEVLPSALRLRYRLSLDTFASLAMLDIPRAFATFPSAVWNISGSLYSATALR